MAYVEIQKKGNKKYFYLTKSVRIANNKWRKERIYLGDKKPSDSVINKKLKEIEKKYEDYKFENYDYLDKEEVELLEDLKSGFAEWKEKTPDSVIKKTNENFVVKYTYNTNAIEGNKLTLRQTAQILIDKVIPAGVRTKDYNEAVNGKEALKFIENYEKDFNHQFLLKLNEVITKNTDVFYSGRIRPIQVSITGSDHEPPSPEKLNYYLGRLYNWYNKNKNKMHVFELAVIVHARLTWIHPFEDGNGRTSRAVMNFILKRSGYPMFFIPDEKRETYYNALGEADKKNYKKYVKIMLKLVHEQIKEIIKLKNNSKN